MKDQVDFHANGWACTYARFNSAELAEIVGISGPIQRLWRSRGLLPGRKETRLTYTSREVAEIMVRYDLSKLGVSPGNSAYLGRLASNLILWFALLNADGACEVSGSLEEVDQFLKRFEQDEQIASVLCEKPSLNRYIVKSAEGSPHFQNALEPNVASDGPRSMAFLDLDRAAFELASKSRRPLITVSLGADAGAVKARRLTGQRRPHLRLV